jgi:hypothetical protein
MTRCPLLATASVVAVAAASLGAQTPPPKVLAVCYVLASGTVYRIDEPPDASAPGAPRQCLSPARVRFVWSAEGPRGPQGPAGPPGADGVLGYRQISRMLSVSPGGPSQLAVGATLQCGSDEVVLGAGFRVAWVNDGIQLRGSHPADHRTWFVWLFDPTSQSVEATSFALCARAPSS